MEVTPGFELDDTIPNHSTFSKTRTRKWQQSSLFQKAFYEIVKQCIDSGLIDGEAMAADGSYIPANVSRESWINVETEVEQSMQSYLDSLDEELSNQPGFKKPPTKIVRKCRTTSQTDPDSGYINHGSKRGIGYLMEATVDCKHGILTGVDVYSANEKESLLVLRHLERQINLGIPMSRLALDRGYETGAVHRGLELLGITGYIPAIQFSNPPEKYGFSYDPQLDAFICPKGVPLTYHRLNCSKSTGKYLRCYQVEGDACMRCPKRPGCFDKAGIRRRVLASSCYPAFFRGHQRVGTPEYLSMMRLRKIWAEGSFSVLKREHCISRIRKRGILAATEECLLAAMALNLKRMVNAIFRYFQIYCSAGTTVGFSNFFCFCQQVRYCTLSLSLSELWSDGQVCRSRHWRRSPTATAGSIRISYCWQLILTENLPMASICVMWRKASTEEETTMTIIVTGGAGFIGSNFIFYMLDKHPEDRIVCVDKLTYAGNLSTLESVMDKPNFRFVKADICDRKAIYDLFEEEHPDVVVNFAAESHVDRSIENPEVFLQTNILGTQVMLDACRKYGIQRYHQVSTDEVYGDLPLDRPDLFFTEETPIHTSSPYSSSKAGADLLVLAYHRTYGLPVTVSRCSNNYGPYHFPEKLIPLMIANALNDKPLPVYGEGLNVRDWLYVEDHCKAIDLIIRNGRVGEVYNIGGHNEMRNIDIVRLICQKLGKPESLITYVTDRKGHDMRYAIDPTKIHSELGWLPETKFADGIDKTIDWYLTHRDWWENIINGEYQHYYERMYGNR